jgi:Bacterial capsule synthesis protein PGA_cap
VERLRPRHVVAIAACLVAGLGAALLVTRVWASSPALADTSSTTAMSTDTETGTTATAPTVTAPAPAPPTKRKRLATFTFVAGGDVALSGDPEPAIFAEVRRFLRSGDLAMANLEGPLATAPVAKCLSGSSTGCFAFRASPAWAVTLRRAGFTDLNLANNHALDDGQEGQRETLAALRGERLAYDGLPGQITYLHVRSIKVAVIGCAPYSWAQDLRDIAGTQALVRKAARHAHVVIVYMHAGAEGADALHVANREETYLDEDRGNPVAFAHAMVDAGADLVFASGPHVLRGMQWYRHRLIAYSLGNLATSHTLSTVGILAESALLRVELDAHGGLVAGSVIPLRLDSSGTPAVDRRRTSIGLIRSLSREDFPRSAVHLSVTGALVLPNAASR